MSNCRVESDMGYGGMTMKIAWYCEQFDEITETECDHCIAWSNCEARKAALIKQLRSPIKRSRFRKKLLNPRSSESRIPLLVIDSRWKWGFYFQMARPGAKYKKCFGLYLRVPFIMARWGCA